MVYTNISLILFSDAELLSSVKTMVPYLWGFSYSCLTNEINSHRDVGIIYSLPIPVCVHCCHYSFFKVLKRS